MLDTFNFLHLEESSVHVCSLTVFPLPSNINILVFFRQCDWAILRLFDFENANHVFCLFAFHTPNVTSHTPGSNHTPIWDTVL